MSLAKARKLNPRQLATDVLAKLEVSDFCEKVEIAGAGFLNFRLKISALAQTLKPPRAANICFLKRLRRAKTVVIDFSSPNVAKPMHVGHIRSTILGDGLARTLRLLGHRVITDNHIGDWGTQFGMLLLGWKQHLRPDALKADPLGEMERLYKLVSAAAEAQDSVRDAARQELVKLQGGDEENLNIWREMLALSQQQFDSIYARLGVKFDHTLGESFYNPRLKPLVDELLAKGIARESEGAIAIFFDDNPQLKEHPALIRKSDGGFQLHHDRPRHARLSAGNLAAGRNHLRHRRTAATALPAAFRRVPQMAIRLQQSAFGLSEARPRLVRLHPGRRRQAVQNPLRRNRETGRLARRSRGARF